MKYEVSTKEIVIDSFETLEEAKEHIKFYKKIDLKEDGVIEEYFINGEVQ